MTTNLMDVAIEAARAAGAIIRAAWGQPHTVTLKGATNPVTEIDHAAEELIVKRLKAATPGYGILAEESREYVGDSDARWVIDPLDGTVNYAHHFPYFAVTVGLERAGQTVLGVVYDPILDQLFSAERGRGAWLNDEPIQVSRAATLLEAIVATGFPYDVWETGRNIAQVTRLAPRVQSVRVNGCAGLDFAYVACGRLEAYCDTGLAKWDVAAGRLLVEEAGGRVTFLGGNPDIIQSQFMLASNPVLHSPFLEIILPVDNSG